MKLGLALIIVVTLFTVACGGSAGPNGGNSNVTVNSNLQGQWEIAIADVLNGQTEYVELNLSQSPDGKLTASNSFVFFLDDSKHSYSYCNPPSAIAFSGSVNGNQVSGTITTCYGSANFSGSASNSNSAIGTYTSSAGCGPSGAQCVSGSFSGQKVPAISGTYSGTLIFSNGISDIVTVAVSSSNSGSMTVAGSGQNTGTISMAGVAVGKTAYVQGTAAGGAASVYAWQHGNLVYVIDADGPLLGTLTRQ